MTTLKQPTASLYVGNLDPSVTEDILHEAFAEFKTLTFVRLCKDSSGRSLGYGYANFLSCEEANLAIIGKNNTLLEGKVMQVWPEASGVSNQEEDNLPIESFLKVYVTPPNPTASDLKLLRET